MQITDDEYTVLMIADHGEYMAPIGRWEAPVKKLAAQGLLTKLNDFNFVINDQGRAALEGREKENDQALLNVIAKRNQVVSATTEIRDKAEQIAVQLAEIARMSAGVTGDSPERAAWKWSDIILKRAKNLLNG